MKKKRFLPLLLALSIMVVLPGHANAAGHSEEEAAAAFLREQEIMVGDQNGEMNLSSELTRAQLAVVLTRLHSDPAQVEKNRTFFTIQCSFPDVPDWAKQYAGYCAYLDSIGQARFTPL